MLKKLLSLQALFTISHLACSNNISVSNITHSGKDALNDFVLIQFDLSWDNSWRTDLGPSNWDAAWIFIKYRLASETEWNHCTLHYADGTGTGDGHTVPTGATITSSDDTGTGGSYGVFVYADASHSQQTVSYNGVQLRWEYGVDGLADDDIVEVSVFAIEMVYITQGDFEIGDGNGSNESTNAIHPALADNTSVTITNSLTGDIRVDTNFDDDATLESGIGIDGDGGIDIDNDGDIDGTDNSLFPTGYSAFYISKYEISQGQWSQFINTLTATQDANRYHNTSSNRYTISGAAGSRSASAPNRACNFLSWMDVSAYADWAGLRPMTELEYEKAARGFDAAIYQECAWGTTNLHASTYTLTSDGTADAAVSSLPATGNASHGLTDGALNGPMRCGIFAGSSPNSRQESGSSYFGVMELTGNLDEPVVSIGLAVGRSFTGNHGDGVLSVNGHANQTTWPGLSSGEVTGADGSGRKGGHYNSLTSSLYVSNRSDASNESTLRIASMGGRVARTAP